MKSSHLDTRSRARRSSLVLVALMAFAAPSAALEGDEKRCVASRVAEVERVGASFGEALEACVRAAAEGAPGGLGACIEADPELAAAQTRAAERDAQRCAGAPLLVSASASQRDETLRTQGEALLAALLGEDPDAAVLPSDSQPQAARCQSKVLQKTLRCGERQLERFGDCAKEAVGRKKSTQKLHRCVEALAADSKVKKACRKKLRSTVKKQCSRKEVEIADALPRCASDGKAEVGSCLEAPMRCHSCQLLNRSHRLNADCDALDDGLSNRSCASGSLLALSYNVAGLPEVLSGSQPDLFTPLISPLLNAYDLVLVQESWQTPDPNPLDPLRVYHEVLVAQADHPHQSESAPLPLGSDPRRPEALVSDGLNRLSIVPFDEVTRVAWDDCYNPNAADCLAFKGFSVARTEVAPGIWIDVYNLHMEAGNGPEDEAIRDAGITQLADFINANSAGQALIVGGDFNLHSDEEPDATQFARLLAETGLRDVCEELGCPDPGRIDKFLFRSSPSITVTPRSWRFEIDVFQAEDGEPLSDHDPLAVRFDWAADPL